MKKEKAKQGRVRIKMCGMTQALDVQYAISLGVDALGFIFYPRSTRYISISDAIPLIRVIPPFVARVAVFVNPTREEVLEVLHAVPIHCIQFHGEETAAFCQQFQYPYIKAIAARSKEHILEIIAMHEKADAFLIDTPSHDHGGSGKTFDWNMIPQEGMKCPLIVAGGLHSENIENMFQCIIPYAVDVCTGVESMPGVKNHDKMAVFIKKCGKQ